MHVVIPHGYYFQDISGAFDNILWPTSHNDIEVLGASHSIRSIIYSYLKSRSASITASGPSLTVNLTKGCPQGSLLGPLLWNATMENLLPTHLEEHTRIQAYADDIAIIVCGNSRTQIVSHAASALQRALTWGNQNKHRNLTLLYRDVFVSRIAYDITLWSSAITASVVTCQPYPLQRKALLGITSAYLTTSTV